MKNDQTNSGFSAGINKQVKLTKIDIKNFNRPLKTHNFEEKELEIREYCLNTLN